MTSRDTETRDNETMPRSTDPLTGQSTMAQALAGDPNLPVVLMRFHIGGCSLCGFEPEQTVAEVAEDNGVPLEVLLEALNTSRRRA